MSDLHYVSFGQADHPPVLFLHGFMGSSSDWQEIASALQSDFYCLCVDLPGHGRSVGFEDRAAYTMTGTAKLLGGLLADEGLDSAHLVGYSMGGRTALYFAAHNEELCRRLVLESASPGLEHELDRRERRGVDEARAQRLETGELLAFLEEWYRQPLFKTYAERPDLLSRMIESRRANDPIELAHSLRGMGAGTQPAVWHRLAEVRLPTVAVSGSLDGKYVEAAERMAALMPNLRTAIIPNAGHNVHAERPGLFVDIIRDFLTKPI